MPTATRVKCCDPCRLLHHKCDGILPQCGRCTRTGRACVRGQKKTQFRQAKGRGPRTRFPRNQVWLRPPPRVDFVLESGNGEPDDLAALPSVEAESVDPGSPVMDHNPTPESIAVPPNTQHRTAEDVEVLAYRCDRDGKQRPPFRPTGARRELRSGRRTWPLRDPEEAYLLQHFVDRIASFFDCTDRQQHFAVHIPYRARYCDTLFNAIMALSARHLSCTTTFDPYVSDQYYQACLETLIPSLNDHGVTMDDDLLAATVILRLLEEFDVPLAGSDLRGHSFGTKAFIQGPPPSATTTPSLRQAVYWSGLRQEIYNALSLQQAPDVDLSSLHSLFTALGPDAGDCAWANQAIAHCADVLLFSFGDGPRSVAVHEDLQKQNEQWSDTRPASFDPYFVGSDEVEIGASFPDIRFSSPWHAIGNQYNELARILLSVHNPGLPTVGPLRRRFAQEADYQIRKGVWTVCGVALANDSVPPAMVVGCMAIHICGDRFTDRQEQERLIQVLIRTDSSHGWPTHALQRQLRETWSLP
ncbi:hypothetical protein N7532_010931 [Penicillium argentinense]|uniref:Zn(2)-C6 fungal-type domain-containing protein n=1 Tax=Penicillium argentinense TaxID=1131581 RepID=A0A9W9JYH7_9EURO|nr:uncharacterized protein N7532_010931 [Penicillium argentinense]KAJ5086160.1 hypothetical protein N7532_010931 [Penicillium argentinense]